MKITEENYVALMQRGNERALQYFIEEHGWIVKSIVCKKLSGYVDAQDECINDTFMAIWQNVHKYDCNKAKFTTWVAAVTRYQVLNCIRNFVEPIMENVENLEIVGDADVNLPLMHKEEEQEFRAMLKILSPTDQEIFMRIFWDEYSHKDVAEEFGLKKEDVYNHLSKGKKKLRKSGVGRRS